MISPWIHDQDDDGLEWYEIHIAEQVVAIVVANDCSTPIKEGLNAHLLLKSIKGDKWMEEVFTFSEAIRRGKDHAKLFTSKQALNNNKLTT